MTLIVAAVFAYRNWPAPIDWVKGGSYGRIIVNSPTIYTRQRLVNDRLAQANWLQRQLLRADDDFHGIDQIYSRKEQKVARGSFRAGGNASEDSDQKNSEKKASPDSRNNEESEKLVLVRPTTAADFRARNLFREEVRAEITQTQLDDRHDIEGNTVYRLAFDTTVLAGTRRDAIAIVRAKLAEANTDYSQLYLDWVRHTQNEAITSVGNLAEILVSRKADPRIRLLMARFLTNSICRRLAHTQGRDLENRCSLAAEVAEGYLTLYVTAARENSDARFDEVLRPILSADKLLATDEERLKRAVTYVRTSMRNACQSGALERIALGTFIPKELVPANFDSIECPFYITHGHRLLASVLLYEELEIAASEFAAIVSVSDNKTAAASKILDRLRDQHRMRCERKLPDADATLCGFPDQRRTSRCVVSDFLTENYNASDRIARPSSKIGQLFTSHIVGRNSGDCGLVVEPMGNTTPHTEIVQSQFLPSAMAVERFRDYLKDGIEVFTYSVAPRNLAETTSTSIETRDNHELMAAYTSRVSSDLTVLAQQLQDRRQQLQSLLTHPIVVGFAVDSNPSTQAQFGWLVGPRRRAITFEQVDQQYTLTAVVSVPSWWRSAKLTIESCWLDRTDLPTKVPQIANGSDSFANACGGQAAPHEVTIKLPGAIAELSRKLGYEVIQEPSLHLSSDAAPQILRIGESGTLLFRGYRLWRSAEVTVGSQRADEIVVLPNMEGIVATFRCVEPQYAAPAARDQTKIETSAYVWTSEGVTIPAAPVTLIWPPTEQNENGVRRKMCFDRGDETGKKSNPSPSPLQQGSPASLPQ